MRHPFNQVAHLAVAPATLPAADRAQYEALVARLRAVDCEALLLRPPCALVALTWRRGRGRCLSTADDLTELEQFAQRLERGDR